MRNFLLLSAAIAAIGLTSAGAQTPPETEFTLKLNAQDVNTISAGLQELPAKIANPLWQKLNSQVQAEYSKAQASRTPSSADVKK